MLLKGSIIFCRDNSGAKKLKVLQLYTNKYNHAGEGIRCVMRLFNPERNKLQKKKHYTVGCIGVLQYTQRFSGYAIHFCKNAIIMFNDSCTKLLGTRIYGVIQREALRLKTYDSSLVHKMILLARFII